MESLRPMGDAGERGFRVTRSGAVLAVALTLVMSIAGIAQALEPGPYAGRGKSNLPKSDGGEFRIAFKLTKRKVVKKAELGKYKFACDNGLYITLPATRLDDSDKLEDGRFVLKDSIEWTAGPELSGKRRIKIQGEVDLRRATASGKVQVWDDYWCEQPDAPVSKWKAEAVSL